MPLKHVQVRVPATTANLGPGFDCLALALDLWNTAEFSIGGDCMRVKVTGEGEGKLPEDQENLVMRSFLYFYETQGLVPPTGLQVVCHNDIPVNSGLGSSAAAALAGLLGANVLSGMQHSTAQLLTLATKIEGHPDNSAAALFGGLVVVITDNEIPVVRRFDPYPWNLALILPEIHLPTPVTRAALPKEVSLKETVYNLGRVALVVEALRTGDADLLEKSMSDRLHEPYRLPLIPGAAEALQAARRSGARAAVISGAGPGLLIISDGDLDPALRAMGSIFSDIQLPFRTLHCAINNKGAQIINFS